MDTVDGYQLVELVSENRSISMWKGRDAASARDVALKQIELTTTDTIERLRAQARVLVGLSHPSIVEVFGLVEEDDQAWLVADWVNGASLAAVLASGGPLAVEQSVAVLSELLDALGHAHEQAIVHGDVAVANVLLERTGVAKLTNFGRGAAGAAFLTPSTDVRAAGELLRTLVPAGPLTIDEVCRRAASADPARRYRDVAEFRVALEQAPVHGLGADWRERGDVRARVAWTLDESALEATRPGGTTAGAVFRIGPAVIRTALPIAASAQVRATNRPPAAIDRTAEMRSYLEPRPPGRRSREGRPDWFIPVVAAIVVVVAIVILVFTHRAKKVTDPGLVFRGTYSISITLQTPGVGAHAGKPAGSVIDEKWQVTPTCTSAGRCTVAVTPSGGGTFALALGDGDWTGERAMPTASGCVGGYSFGLSPSPSSSAGEKMVGTVIGVSGGCGPLGTESGAVVVTRTSS